MSFPQTKQNSSLCIWRECSKQQLLKWRRGRAHRTAAVSRDVVLLWEIKTARDTYSHCPYREGAQEKQHWPPQEQGQAKLTQDKKEVFSQRWVNSEEKRWSVA